ncbi:hypothetical protein ZTR_05621 [Talaromyces verruculosus]|nr:hypothetical protein ZTR_05621 [Talaromyces verruculosus]
MSEPHPYRKLKIPDDAPIELKPSPGKGWGVFATRHIKEGDLILKEKATFIISKPAGENVTENDVGRAWSSIRQSEREMVVQCLRNNGSQHFVHLMEMWLQDNFTLTSQDSALVAEGYYRPGVQIREGLFPLQGRFNHSCLPNARIPWTKSTEDSISNFAMRDIAAGEEITICYDGHFQFYTRKERHEILGFACDCRACDLSDDNKLFQQHSDMRRTILRGLFNHRYGKDLSASGEAWPPTIIVDPELKRAAESYNIPLSTRFIHGVLFTVLMEEEGLLDDFATERIYATMVFPPTMFKTENNRRIAERALDQDTWLEVLGVAFELDGRSDADDQSFAEDMRRGRAELTAP